MTRRIEEGIKEKGRKELFCVFVFLVRIFKKNGGIVERGGTVSGEEL